MMVELEKNEKVVPRKTSRSAIQSFTTVAGVHKVNVLRSNDYSQYAGYLRYIPVAIKIKPLNA